MAKRRSIATSASRRSSNSGALRNVEGIDAAVARPNDPVRRRSLAVAQRSTRESAPTDEATGSGGAVAAFVSSWLPNAVVVATAYAAVAYGFTTSPEFVHSQPLLLLFKKAFIALVCLAARAQLAEFLLPPGKPRTLARLAWAHAKGLVFVILANCAGTTVIQPLLGLAPQYADTVELVIPIYVGVELALGVLAVPVGVVHFATGFLVSWFKAVTMSKLVMQWQADDGAHPVAFLLICTCNLFASGLVLRFIAHFHTSRRVFALSLGLVWSLLQIMGVSALVGLLAHVANHFSTQAERQLEATVLYFALAWYALDKYWKASVRAALEYAFAPQGTGKSKTA